VTTDDHALLAPYDAILVLSFGGPEGHDEVMPFLERVTAGRGIPAERLAQVAEHYHVRGGVSPINAQNRALVEALTLELAARGVDLPVRLGNRNSAPFLVDTLRELRDEGRGRILVLLTSAYSSYSSCRQYRENLADAVAELAGDGRGGSELDIDVVAPWFGLPSFAATMAGHLSSALEGSDPARTRVLHVTHSLPVTMAQSSGPPDRPDTYVAQHRDVADRVDALAARPGQAPQPSDLVYCSRSGPPHQPWLEPDVGDRIAALAGEGVSTVVLVPIGFVSDHMEVVNDLDTDAVAAGRAVGVEVRRVPTVGADPTVVSELVDLLAARAASARGHQVASPWASALPRPCSPCPGGCCPNPRAGRPALGGTD
jgi:ferrochelatase